MHFQHNDNYVLYVYYFVYFIFVYFHVNQITDTASFKHLYNVDETLSQRCVRTENTDIHNATWWTILQVFEICFG